MADRSDRGQQSPRVVHVLQGLLAGRIARAAWRLERAEHIEAELFVRYADGERSLGLAMIRDGNGARAFDTLLRYRGATLAELWRALRLLKAIQAEAHASDVREAASQVDAITAPEQPIEPEGRADPGEIAPPPAATGPEAAPQERVAADAAPDAKHGGMGPAECPRAPRAAEPIKPESRRKPGDVSPPTAAEAPAAAAARDELDAPRPAPPCAGAARPMPAVVGRRPTRPDSSQPGATGPGSGQA